MIVMTRLTRPHVSTTLALTGIELGPKKHNSVKNLLLTKVLTMASIHKRDRSPYYWAAWRDATGRLYYRSTKQTDRHKALAFALECERAEKHATAGTLTESQARKILGSIMERTQTGDTLRNPKATEWLR